MAAQRKLRNVLSIVIGITVAISTSLLTIDWAAFDFKKEWPKLLLSALIAAGGFLSRLKEIPVRTRKTEKSTENDGPSN